jgi:hypothetical protein
MLAVVTLMTANAPCEYCFLNWDFAVHTCENDTDMMRSSRHAKSVTTPSSAREMVED